MSEIARWNRYIVGQQSLLRGTERELMLNISVPLEADQELFRVGWDLKRPGSGRFIAITSGMAVWDRRKMAPTSEHIYNLMCMCNEMLEPGDPRDRR